ncbi:MAG: PglZ domain-containing protein [Chloroflexi bacterium]|nr:PglZ domain-containing protein [Bacteroidota bacterium]MCL5110973.1 PglZ domain-containing protein [Chloroflexota bacterium]
MELLADDLVGRLQSAADGVPRRVLLWLDPEAQFARLARRLAAPLAQRGVQLLLCEPGEGQGQLALKLALLGLESSAEERAVVYLPGQGREALAPKQNGVPALWGLYEYRFKGAIWGLGEHWQAGEIPEPPTLLHWLLGHGLGMADDKTAKVLTVGGRDALLARYAERQRDLAPEHWPRPLRLSDAEEALAGDPRDALRRLLAAPNNEVKRWDDQRPLVLQRLADEYGLAIPAGEAPPEVLADAFAIQMALTEAWDAFGRPSDFPFLSRLPAKGEQRERLARFLREEVVRHTELGPTFLRRMTRLEVDYSLAAWAQGHSGQPVGLPLLARARWQHFLANLKEAAEIGWRQARDLILEQRQAIDAAAKGPWERMSGLAGAPGEWDTHWLVLADLAELAAAAEEAMEGAGSLKNAAELVAAYADRWWQIDRLHLRLRAACSTATGLTAVRQVVDRAYFEYTSQVNAHFAELVEGEGIWPPQGAASVAGLRSALWAGGGRRAVVVSDALRWDLAQTLQERLDDGCSPTPVLATLPAETAFGMSVLLPLGKEPVTVEFGEGPDKLAIRQGDGPNLATREGRRDFLKANLSAPAGKTAVEFLEMEALLQGAKVPAAQTVVVFDNNIDEQGHKGTEELPALLGQLIGNLKRTVEVLHAAGIEKVHVVTDHGFLLVPPEQVDALGTPSVSVGEVYHRDYRWAALKPDAPTTEVIRLPLSLAPKSHTLGLPRGLRTLVKAVAYLHGGLSLQECVIPHLVSVRSLPRVRVGVALQVSTTHLSGGTVPLIIRPALAEGQTLLGGVEPISLRLTVATLAAPGQSSVEVAEPVTLELKPDVEELRPPIYLKEGLGLRAGQELMLQAVDDETGADKGKIFLTLRVDWD